MGVLNGVINLNKPSGITSCDAIRLIKRRLKVKKAGHAGTLDPMATGVLPVCLGKATRIIPFLPNDKEYEGEMILGISTHTQDATGRVTSRRPVDVTADDIVEVMKSFVGEIEQIPPMVSAVRKQGARLYELARRNIGVDRKPRRVKIYFIDIIDIEVPIVKFSVGVSKGTYIRTLCNDVGERLGCGAYLSKLVRTRSGTFTLDGSLKPEEVTEKSIIPMDSALGFMTWVKIKPEAKRRVLNGAPLRDENIAELSGQPLDETIVKVQDGDGNLLAVAKFDGGIYRILRVLAGNES
ncbi:MAG: tRNA pseudouridine(55) synthase TruB [bacterium]